MSLHVVEPGLSSLLVDLGRPAHRSLGVPVGGAADRLSFTLGNALVGNAANAPALEVTSFGPTLRADADTGVVVHGAPFKLWCGDQALAVGKSFTWRAGQVLRILGSQPGPRAYLCVAGGFLVPAVLGSRSALQPIRKGETLVCASSTLPARSLYAAAPSSLRNEKPIALRFLPGSQADWFDSASFTGQMLEVTPASNRMGLRLRGEPLPRPARELVSEPVCPGSVQVTNDGQCIILGVDAQTIGGYPKIAQVIRADLDCLGQLSPGQLVQFIPVTLEEAEAGARRQFAELRDLLARLAIVCDCSGSCFPPSL